MAKPRSRRVDFAVYVVARCFVCVLQALPFPIALRLGEFLGWLAYTVDKRHRDVARDNLLHAFPELRHQPVKLERMVLGCFRHFCTMLIEMMFLPRKLRTDNWRNWASLRNGGRIVDGMLSDRPLLIVTGHFGNWEMAGYALGALGFKTYAIARTLDNPYLERFLKRFRQNTGQTILAKKGDFDNIAEVLATGGKLATLGDQDAGPRGMFVNFFNRPASTHKAVALLALQFEVPMVVAGVPGVGPSMRYEMVVEEVIYPEEYVRSPDAVRAMTERYTQALERLIRRYPEQYFWLHRRWKHQPAAKKARAA